jgi:hypothetical protein
LFGASSLKALVTGGAGFIGSNLCERLARDGNSEDKSQQSSHCLASEPLCLQNRSFAGPKSNLKTSNTQGLNEPIERDARMLPPMSNDDHASGFNSKADGLGNHSAHEMCHHRMTLRNNCACTLHVEDSRD